MADSPAITLPCKQCGYVNEPERVYCHNCGSKLDRSILPKEDQVDRETPDKARARIRKMTNPDKNRVMREVKTLLRTIFWAVCAALIIQIVRAPDTVPVPQQNVLPRLISSDLMDAVESQQPRSVTFTDADVNAYLKSSIRDAKEPGWASAIIDFKRIFVAFTPGVCHICMERNLWGLTLYAGTDYKLEVVNGVFTPTNVGGSFGRLPVHPLLMKYAGQIFSGLWTALHREHQQMQQMQFIRIDKGSITMVSHGTAKR